MRGDTWVFLAVALSLGFFFARWVGASEPLDREVKNLLATIRSDSGPEQTAEVCGKLFKHASPALIVVGSRQGQD